uniref:Uncharacterized protein n=1 Tax=Anguilla anguilla TaxID=7936 RepID=A0A0E9WHV8_ANGAN
MYICTHAPTHTHTPRRLDFKRQKELLGKHDQCDNVELILTVISPTKGNDGGAVT